MPGIQALPTWVVALAAILATGLFVWRFVSLMTTKKQKLAILRAAAVMVVLLGLLASIKHNSANHALVLLGDVMVALVVGTLPAGRELARVNRLSAETGKQLQISQKYAGLFALVTMVCLEAYSRCRKIG